MTEAIETGLFFSKTEEITKVMYWLKKCLDDGHNTIEFVGEENGMCQYKVSTSLTDYEKKIIDIDKQIHELKNKKEKLNHFQNSHNEQDLEIKQMFKYFHFLNGK